MSSNFQSFGFGRDDENVGKMSRRFKAQEGRTYRLSFVWWAGMVEGKPDLEASTPEFLGAQRNYINGVGYVLNRGPEYTKIAGDSPRMAIATAVISWPITPGGKVDFAAIKEGKFEVQPWVIGKEKYKDLKELHQEFPFGKFDLKIRCTDTKYQKISIQPCQESILVQIIKNAGSLKDQVVEQVAAVVENIGRDIGREMTLDQIREKQAGGSGSSGPAPTTGTSSQEIDAMVDNFLD